MKQRLLGVTIMSLLTAHSAQADNLAEAFKNGTVSGDLNLYYKGMDNQSATDSGYASGYLGLKYETAPLSGIQLGLAIRHGTEAWEKTAGDSDEGVGTLVTEAYISYRGDGFGATVGRQEVDLEWVADFHEAVTLTSDALPNSELSAGYSRSLAVADEDDLQHSFSDIGDNGAWFLDAKISPAEELLINPYYIHEDEVYDGLGLKADFEFGPGLGATAHYAASDVEMAGESDGSILHLELRGTLGGLALAAGYIETDQQGGVGHLDDLGENINPFEDGNQVYVADAQTWYLGGEYSMGRATVGLLVGNSDYAGNGKEREIDLTLAYDLADIAENLSVNLVYADIDAAAGSDDYEKLTLMLSYGF